MSAGQMSNLQLRIISAVVLAVAVLSVTWLGGLSFRLLACIIGGAILYEWYAMSRPTIGGASSTEMLGAAGFGLVTLALVLGFPAGASFAVLGVAIAATFLYAMTARQPQWHAAGLAYAGLSAISLAYLRDGDHAGLLAILFLFAVVWATDIAAYFVGRAVGGPKLAPAISPGKTQSGAVGGAIGAVIAGLLLAWVAGLGDIATLAVVALILSVVSQAGDLFESWVKRRHNAKDSGSIIPGHGGVMDRVDGLVAAALALYLLGAMASGPDQPAHALFTG